MEHGRSMWIDIRIHIHMDEMVDLAVNEAVAEAESIFDILENDTKTRHFLVVLSTIDSNVGPEGRIDAHGSGRLVPFVYPSRFKMIWTMKVYAKLMNHLFSTYPDHARQMRDSVLAVVVKEVRTPQVIAVFLANLPSSGSESENAVYGLVDRVKMLMERDSLPVRLPKVRAQLVVNPLANLIESLHMMTILNLDPDAVKEQWPAPHGYGFLATDYKSGKKISCELQVFGTRLDLMGCWELISNQKGEKGCIFIESMLEPSVTDTRAIVALECIKDYQVREVMTNMLTEGADQVRTIMRSLTTKEWLVAVLSLRAKRSPLTGDYKNYVHNEELHGMYRYAKWTIDERIQAVINNLFVDDVLIGQRLARLFVGEDPFMNEAFDEEIYGLSARWKKSWGLEKKKRIIPEPDLVKGPSLIRTHIAQMELIDVDRDANQAFDCTGLEYKTGEWITEIDLRACSKKVRDRHLTEYIRWIEKHRMRSDDMRFDMDAIVVACAMVILDERED